MAAHNGRLNFRGWSGTRLSCWIAADTDTEPWIQIDFLWIVTVSGVLSQGRHDLPQWVTSYAVSSKVDGMTFQFYMENGQKKVQSLQNFIFPCT